MRPCGRVSTSWKPKCNRQHREPAALRAMGFNGQAEGDSLVNHASTPASRPEPPCPLAAQ
jgi:hypothetical protein